MNAATVSKALKANGFLRSEQTTTRVKGWHDVTTGFEVKQGHSVPVAVFYTFGSGFYKSNTQNEAEVRSAKLQSMAKLLIAKGYEVSLQETYLGVIGKVAA
jgi:hypothetical protein